jgi:hypothetical protein
MTALTEEVRRRREEAKKQRKIVNGIIEFLTPTIKGMKMWEIKGLLNEVLSTIELKFHPFRTFGQATSYRKGK